LDAPAIGGLHHHVRRQGTHHENLTNPAQTTDCEQLQRETTIGCKHWIARAFFLASASDHSASDQPMIAYKLLKQPAAVDWNSNVMFRSSIAALAFNAHAA
jgi:hypothetical protein